MLSPRLSSNSVGRGDPSLGRPAVHPAKSGPPMVSQVKKNFACLGLSLDAQSTPHDILIFNSFFWKKELPNQKSCISNSHRQLIASVKCEVGFPWVF
jgi:hypothetical protein